MGRSVSNVLISQNLSPETIELARRVDTAEDAIKLLSARLAPLLPVDRTAIERAVISRERARTTALPNGAAIPHCRRPGRRRFGCALLVLAAPVRWDHEGHCVDVVLMIVGPAENVSDHLRILANSSRLLDSPTLRARLKTAPGPAQAHELITAAERAIESRRQETGTAHDSGDRLHSRADDYLAEVANRFNW